MTFLEVVSDYLLKHDIAEELRKRQNATASVEYWDAARALTRARERLRRAAVEMERRREMR